MMYYYVMEVLWMYGVGLNAESTPYPVGADCCWHLIPAIISQDPIPPIETLKYQGQSDLLKTVTIAWSGENISIYILMTYVDCSKDWKHCDICKTSLMSWPEHCSCVT